MVFIGRHLSTQKLASVSESGVRQVRLLVSLVCPPEC